MSAPVLAFFNNKGGVGKTSLVFHLAWLYADRGHRVIAADLDPQANLTAAFLDDDRLEALWFEQEHRDTIFGALRPLLEGWGDVQPVHVEQVADNLGLVVGDLGLSGFEDELSSQWPDCLDRKERAFRVVSAFWRILAAAAEEHEADLVLLDVGPNLGAINRATLVAADRVVIPLSPDLFSLQGLRNLGPTLRRWRGEWQERRERNPRPDRLALPEGRMEPIGYVVLQHGIRLDRPVQAYDRWIRRIPEVYGNDVLGTPVSPGLPVREDPNCLALLKHYHSLIPMAQEARKPIFHLKPADGALGAHLTAVRESYFDFKRLADAIDQRLSRRASPPEAPEEPRGRTVAAPS